MSARKPGGKGHGSKKRGHNSTRNNRQKNAKDFAKTGLRGKNSKVKRNRASGRPHTSQPSPTLAA